MRGLVFRQSLAPFIWLTFVGAAMGHTTVGESTIVTHMGERVPRFASLTGNHLIVPEGETVMISKSAQYDAIEVAGTLRIARNADFTLRFNHLTVLPGGVLDCGTVDNPVIGDVQLVIRDTALDVGTLETPGSDPFQFGQAILNFGTWYSCGAPMDRTWLQATGSLAQDQTVIELVQEPVGWSVGDRVTLADTRQMNHGRDDVLPRREDGLEIAAIEGTRLTLNKGLAFAREQWTDVDGRVLVRPYVANMTRNVVVRSENPEGTRGHTVIFDRATVDVRYTSFIGLGRTRAEVLHNTKTDSKGTITQIGTNQVARYPFHFHHVIGPQNTSDGVQGRVIGIFVDGTDYAKWGVIIHGTHDTLCRDIVGRRCVGSIISLEDGYEVRNRVLRNYCVEATGVQGEGHGAALVRRGNPGAEGTGIWMHGSQNIVSENVCANNHIGMGVVHPGAKSHMVPASPGEHPSKMIEGAKTKPIEFARNVSLSNANNGVELWDADYWHSNGLVACGNGFRAVWPGSGGDAASGVTLENVQLYRNDGRQTAVPTSLGYTWGFTIHGGRIEGFETGLVDIVGTQSTPYSIRDLELVNRINIDWSSYQRFRRGAFGYAGSPHAEIVNVRCRTWGEGEPKHLILGDGFEYEPGQSYHSRLWSNQTGEPTIKVKDWQGEAGNDFAPFFHAQQPDDLALHIQSSTRGGRLGGGVPEKGLTMQEAWNKYGMAYNGGLVCSEPQSIEGVFALACPLSESITELGPPRAVLTMPVSYFPLPADSEKLSLRFVLTGDQSQADEFIYWTLDGKQQERLGQRRGLSFDERSKDFDIGLTPGMHRIKTWRENDGVKVEGSELSFAYAVGKQEPDELGSVRKLGGPHPKPSPASGRGDKRSRCAG